MKCSHYSNGELLWPVTQTQTEMEIDPCLRHRPHQPIIGMAHPHLVRLRQSNYLGFVPISFEVA